MEDPYETTMNNFHQKLNGTESQRDPGPRKLLARAVRYSGFFRGPWTVGPVGDFLDCFLVRRPCWAKNVEFKFISYCFLENQRMSPEKRPF